MSEMVALKTVKAFNNLASRAAAKGSETLELIWKAGETAKQAKGAIPHGEWLNFVKQHYDVSHDTVTRWIKFHDTVPESKLRTVRNLTAGLKMIEPPKSSKPKPRPGGGGSSSNSAAVVDSPASSATNESTNDERPNPSQDGSSGGSAADPVVSRSDTSTEDLPEDATDEDAVVAPDEKCPACAGTKWDLGPEGWECSKCNHPHGEPAGDPDDDRVSTLRSKTRKTTEALMRCFDDLHHICPNSSHHEAIQWCKSLLNIAREWK